MKGLALVLSLLLMIVGVVSGCGGNDADSDGDGWTDAQEKSAGTDIHNVDTDADGYWDSLDPNPLDASIPAASPQMTPTPAPAPTPAPSASATPTRPAATPGQLFPLTIASQVLDECASQFVLENAEVSSAQVRQTSDRTSLFLEFSVYWEAPTDKAKMLAEDFIRLVKGRVDVPPSVELGTGRYNYVCYAIYHGGVVPFRAEKCAGCTSISWE